MIAHIADEINKQTKIHHCIHQFEVFPIVKKEADVRNNKLEDYTVYKIYNKRTDFLLK